MSASSLPDQVMTIATPAPSASLKRQLPAFVAVGLIGYVIDSSITYALNRAFGVDPYLARFPAFGVATLVNFALNRRLTFAHSTEPMLRAFLRYVMVCAVGLAVNYAAYATALWIWSALGLPMAPQMLFVFVAFGSGVAMFATYFGFRLFAFRV
jgi:putative flippase GtrA